MLEMIPLFAFLTATHPLFNTYNETVLFRVFGRPYTFEALLYGAAMFVAMMLRFGCYNKVLTSVKFASLFGYLIPSISLVLVMAFRSSLKPGPNWESNDARCRRSCIHSVHHRIVLLIA